VKEKITVLIADDNSEFANNLAGYVEQEEEMEVIGMARDGNEAYDMICGTQPDIVLLDVIMPHLDGIGVLEKIKNANLKKTPLSIMLSAVGQDKITQKAISLGAEYYVVKPFDIDVLIKRIKELKNIINASHDEDKEKRIQVLDEFEKKVKEYTSAFFEMNGSIININLE